MTDDIISLLRNARDANYSDKYRQGNLIIPPADALLVATGDIHGHHRNFERIITYADLASHPERHLLLQEIIHGGPVDEKGNCLSYKLLFDAVRYKVDFPDRVHFIMANHDTTFINNGQVIKDGKEMHRSMVCAIDREFQTHSPSVKTAMADFFFSQPLAVKCPNRIWLSHSLPADRCVDAFDKEIFSRKLTIEDTLQPLSAYLLTWGRKHSQETLDKMAKLLDVDIFILGHQRQPQGWSQAGSNLLIIASDHNHGCLLPIDLSKTYSIDQLIASIIPLASIA
jgi:hypothetical protein